MGYGMELNTFLQHNSKVKKLDGIVAKARAEGRNSSYTVVNGVVTQFWVGNQPKRLQGRCGALCRSGEPCKLRVVEGKRRCRLHGGKSTGPKTPEGRARIAESNRKRKENKDALLSRGLEVLEEIERRQSLGLPIVPLKD